MSKKVSHILPEAVDPKGGLELQTKDILSRRVDRLANTIEGMKAGKWFNGPSSVLAILIVSTTVLGLRVSDGL